MSKMCLRRQKFLIPSNCILLSLVFLIKLLYYRYVYISLLIHFFLLFSNAVWSLHGAKKNYEKNFEKSWNNPVLFLFLWGIELVSPNENYRKNFRKTIYTVYILKHILILLVHIFTQVYTYHVLKNLLLTSFD